MVYILLPVHNRKKITLDFIKSLKKQTYEKIFLILIDDGSTDGTADAVIDEYKNTHVIYGNGNLWWAGSLQKGYEYLVNSANVSENDHILIMNDDTSFNEDYIENGIKIIQKNPQYLLGSVAISAQNGKVLDSGKKVNWRGYKIEDIANDEKVECLSTRGLFIPILSFVDIGGFHPYLLPHYLSDYEYTIRAVNKGYKLMSDKSLSLYQNEETTGIHSIKEMNYDIISKLRLIFSKKYAQNPFYISTFILLCCPLKYRLQNILRIWARVFKQLIG